LLSLFSFPFTSLFSPSATFLSMSVVWIRFRHIEFVLKVSNGGAAVERANRRGFWFGMVSSSGMILVACFQETEIST
jgi:hypothetical protein